MSDSTVYAVTGAKGGIGKTTTSIAIVSVLAAAGRSVLLVDTDLAMGNVADFLETPFEDGTTASIHDVLGGPVDPGDAIYEGPLGIDILPTSGSLEEFATTNATDLPALIGALRQREYDEIILDTGAGLSDATLLPVAAADEAILVARPCVGAVENAAAAIDLAGRVETPIAGLVVTDATDAAPDGECVADALEVPLLGTIPRDEAVPVAQEAGTPVSQSDPSGAAAQAYRAIAQRLVETPRLDAEQRPPATVSPDGGQQDTADTPDRSVIGRVAAAVGRFASP